MQNKIQIQERELTRRIMRSIYLVAGIRLLLHPVLLKSLIVGVFFWRSTEYVSYVNVIANAPSFFDLGGSINFFRSALVHAESGATLLFGAMTVLVAWILFDMLNRRRGVWI